MLILSRKKEESIIIDEKIVISVIDIKGDQIKLGIQAPKEVKIYRQEVYEAIQNENKEAVKSSTTKIPKLEDLLK
jgi:carbon storage regulator